MDEDAIAKKFQKELNSGTAALVVLGLMVSLGKPTYGYEIGKLLEELAEGDLPMKQGALYPVLRSMEANELLESEVEPSTSAPPRRYYRVTAAGREMLDRWIEIWGETTAFIERVLTDVDENDVEPEESRDV